MNVTSGILSGLKIIDSELEGVKLDDASVDGMSLGESLRQQLMLTHKILNNSRRMKNP